MLLKRLKIFLDTSLAREFGMVMVGIASARELLRVKMARRIDYSE